MKINFEVDTNDPNYDHTDLEIMTHRHEIMSAIYEIDNFYRAVYNRKFYEETDYKTIHDPLENKTIEYVNVEYVEKRLRNIFDKIKILLD